VKRRSLTLRAVAASTLVILLTVGFDPRAGFSQSDSPSKKSNTRGLELPSGQTPASIRSRVTTLYERGNRFLDAKRYAEAERSFLDALKLLPGLPALHHGLGLAYIQTQDYELAILHFESALKSNPHEVKSLYSISKAYAAIGESEKAKEGYRRVIALDPRMEGAHQDLAGLFYREKKWDEALEHLNHAKAINPKSAHTLMLIGVTGIHAGRQDIAFDAVTELREIRQMDQARRLEYLIYSESRSNDRSNPSQSTSNK
jgi:tetratricopeptide (TPR) repeat protein